MHTRAGIATPGGRPRPLGSFGYMTSGTSALSDGARQRFLLRELVSGSHEAFSRLYDELSGETYAICLDHLHDSERAQFAMASLWLWIWQNAANLAMRGGTPAARILDVATRQARFLRDSALPLASVS